MKPIPFTLATLFLLTIIAGIAPNVAAVVDTTPTNIATSGFYSAIDVKGDTIVIAYRTSASNAIVVSVSQDAGETWIDRPTGTSTTFNRLKIFIIDSDSYTLFFSNYGTAAGQRGYWRTTHDGGLNWSPSTDITAQLNSAECGTVNWSFDTTNTAYPDGSYLDGKWFVNIRHKKISGSDTCSTIWTSTDGITFNYAGTWTIRSTSQHPIYEVIQAKPGSPAPTYEIWSMFANDNRLYRNGALLNDPVVPLTTYGFGAAICPDFTCVFFHDGSATGRVMMGQQQVGNPNLWYFYEVQAGTVNQVQLLAAQTTDGGSGVLMSYTGGARWNYKESADLGTSFQSVSAGTTPHASFIQNGVIGVCGSLWITYQDETTGKLALFARNPENRAGCEEVEATPTQIVNVANLVGFDVDPTGTNLIARQGIVGGRLGANVALYNADSLTVGEVYDSDCQFGYGNPGVSIIHSSSGPNEGDELISALECDGELPDPDNVEAIVIQRVQSDQLVNPNFPDTCDHDPSPCTHFIADEDLAGCDDCRRRLAGLEEFPYDFSRFDTQQLDRTIVSWAYSDNVGNMGVLVLGMIEDHADPSVYEEVNVGGSGTSVEVELCTARFGAKDFLFGATVSGGGTVKGYNVGYGDIGSTSFGAPLDPTNYDGELSLTSIFAGGQISNPDSIACAQDKLLTAAQDDIRFWDVDGGGQVITVATGGGIVDATVALSPDALMGAYTEGTELHVFRTDTMEVVQTFDLPEGVDPTDACDMFMDYGGQNIWWGACDASGVIARYERTIGPYLEGTTNPSQDIDGDGVPDAADIDMDGDGVCNHAQTSNTEDNGGPCTIGPDPDIDGDGLCNGASAAGAAVSDKPAGTPGALNGCVAGDTDNDNDNIDNPVDAVPGGTAPTPGQGGGGGGGGGGGSGLFNVSARHAIIWSLAAIVAFLAIGYRFTAGNRRKEDE